MPKITPARKPAKKADALTPPAAAKKRITDAKNGLRKGPAKKPAHKAAGSAVFMDREVYKVTLDGLMSQGIDRMDAVDTLKVGIREANGRHVSTQLLTQIAASAAA